MAIVSPTLSLHANALPRIKSKKPLLKHRIIQHIRIPNRRGHILDELPVSNDLQGTIGQLPDLARPLARADDEVRARPSDGIVQMQKMRDFGRIAGFGEEVGKHGCRFKAHCGSLRSGTRR